ncbi:hypothetical protein L9F63_021321, partial [Diploptera punctata]
ILFMGLNESELMPVFVLIMFYNARNQAFYDLTISKNFTNTHNIGYKEEMINKL